MRMESAYKKSSKSIKLRNKQPNKRATQYSCHPLLKKPTIEDIAKDSIRDIHAHEKDLIREAGGDSDSITSTYEYDEYFTFTDNAVQDYFQDSSQSDDDSSIPSSNDDDDDDDEEEEEEDDDEWEDMDESDEEVHIEDLDEKLHAISERYKDRWAKFCKGDGYVHGDDHFFKPFTYNDNLEPLQIAKISLLKILSQHKGNDLKLFDRIMTWVFWFSDRHPTIWNQTNRDATQTRKSTLTFLSKFFGTSDLIPHPKEVKLTDGSRVTVPIYDFKTVFERMITDPDLVNDDNLIQDNFDPKTWRPIKSCSDFGPDDLIGDLTTGYLYEEGVKRYCDGDPPPGIAKILPAQ